MFIKELKKCKEIISGDNAILRELLNPLKETLKLRYSLAHAKVKPGEITRPHKLKSSEIYYIIEGSGEMYINNEKKKVSKEQLIYIPPNSIQKIKNIGKKNLIFLCIVDPAWKQQDEEVV
ncbi:MAG: cupin domain-containing protein [bacterium]